MRQASTLVELLVVVAIMGLLMAILLPVTGRVRLQAKVLAVNAELRDTRLQVAAGNVAYIPPQTQHDILNTGAEPLIYVFCAAPAGPRR